VAVSNTAIGRITFVLFLALGLATAGPALALAESPSQETGTEAEQSHPPVELNRTYGGTAYDSISDIISTRDGNYLLIGYSEGNDDDGDAVIRKVEPDGQVIWTRKVGGTEYDFIEGGIRTDSGYLLVGTSASTDSGTTAGWIVRLTDTGEVADEYFYGYSTTSDHLSGITEADDGGYLLAGYSNATDGEGDDGWLVRILSDGTKKWDFIYGGDDDERFFSITKSDSGGFVAAGEQRVVETDSEDNHWDSYVVSVTQSGEVQWTRSLGHDILDDWALDITTTENGQLALAGQRNAIYNSTAGYYEFADAWALTLDPAGTVLSSTTVSPEEYNRFNSLVRTSDSGFLASGYVLPGEANSNDAYVAKFSDTGEYEWNKTYHSSGTEAFGAIATTDTTGEYFAGGIAPAASRDDSDAWFVRVSSPVSQDTDRPDPPADRLGWEDGRWYNETLDIDRSDGLNESELDAVVARSMARVEQIRRIEFQQTPPVSVISRETYRDRYQFGAVSGSAHLFANIKYEALLMINESTDASSVQEQLYDGAVGGFYSPSTGEVVVISENTSTPKMDEITLSQELFHALQDQRFNISYNSTTREQHNANDGIVEGDGNYVDHLYAQRCNTDWNCLMPQETQTQDGQNPHIGLLQILLQPYSSGPRFVRDVRRTGGWDAVNDIYANPPASTEQTIHPEKYPTDTPTSVSIPDRSGDKWRRLSVAGRPNHASVGEAGLFVTLWYLAYETGGQQSVIPLDEHYNSGSDSDIERYLYNHSATAGWDGDRLVPYVTDESGETNETGYVYKSVWDSTEDAAEFHQAYEELLTARGATPVRNHSNVYRIGDDREFGDAFYLNRTDDTVFVVNAPTVEGLWDVHLKQEENIHPSGLTVSEFNSVVGSDGELQRSEVIAAVRGYLTGSSLNGVRLDRDDVLNLVRYYLTQ
jgi:hypothetical protein